MIEQAFVAKALASAPITTLIGSAPMRLYPGVVPRAAQLPACSYVLIDDTREEAMSQSAGLRHGRIQVSCIDYSYLGARQLSDAVDAVFGRYRGTSAGVVVQDTFVVSVDGTMETSEGLERGEGVGMSTVDLLFHYQG